MEHGEVVQKNNKSEATADCCYFGLVVSIFLKRWH